MLHVLRQLTPEESRQVAAQCGIRAGASPEEVVRALSRLCGATVWGLFAGSTDDFLLDHAGRILGMAPLSATGRITGHRAIAARERAIFAHYVRQAWEGAEPERRLRVLNVALAAWDEPAIPRPAAPTCLDDTLYLQSALDSLVQHATGCRALAVAVESLPLPLPSAGKTAGPLAGLSSRRITGHQALYGVLLILWRARARILRERRHQRQELDRQLRQLHSLAAVRERNLAAVRGEWRTDPRCGLSLAAAGGISAVTQLILSSSAVFVGPAIMVGAAGLVWSIAAGIWRPRARGDARVQKMRLQMQAFGWQKMQLDREIAALEAE